MLIGVPREIKDREFRAAMLPETVREVVAHGHKVLVEKGLGAGIGEDDESYGEAGAELVGEAPAIFSRCDLVIKVKEPQPQECDMLRSGQVLFTYLHLAADARLTQALIDSKVTAIAYETVQAAEGGLPLLAPMSEVAGRLSIQAGAASLERDNGGAGILLGGVTGVEPAQVLVIGGGTVGSNAAAIALGMGAGVTVLDTSLARLRQLDLAFAGRANCIFSSRSSVEKYAVQSDLVIGAVLVPGAAAPKLLDREIIARMSPGSVVVDVAIDQGGCFATSHPTTHSDPTFVVDGVVHYCVANMPGVVPRTASRGLANATLPYILRLADQGWQQALAADDGFLSGLNVHAGQVCHAAVALAHQMPWVAPRELVKHGPRA